MNLLQKKSAVDQRKAFHKSSVLRNKQPFKEHVSELRRRLYYVSLTIGIGAMCAYFVQQQVVNILLKPAGSQRFIYTTPGGGIDFLFRVCIYSGIIISLPVIVYNLLAFVTPMMDAASKQFITIMTIASGILAVFGVLFGYFVGLPTALHFLLHQFSTVQIRPLVTIQSYLSFVIAYALGAALIFQLPIILICINRIHPLSPQKLFHYERWVILVAFIMAGLMNPTPNLISQLIVAGPFIIVYQVGIGIIYFMNKMVKPRQKITGLMQYDEVRRKRRNERRQVASGYPF